MQNQNNSTAGTPEREHEGPVFAVDLFDLDCQYSLYLQRVGLDESTMMPIQAQETKRAWFGAAGQILDLLTNGTDSLSEADAIPKLGGLFDQVEHFWMQEVNQHLHERGPDPDGILARMKSPFS